MYVSERALSEWQPGAVVSPRKVRRSSLREFWSVSCTSNVTLAHLCYICFFHFELLWGKSWKHGVCHCSRQSICLKTSAASHQICIGSELCSDRSGSARLGFKDNLQFWWMMQEQEWIYVWPKREWDAAPLLNIDDERGEKLLLNSMRFVIAAL